MKEMLLSHKIMSHSKILNLRTPLYSEQFKWWFWTDNIQHGMPSKIENVELDIVEGQSIITA